MKLIEGNYQQKIIIRALSLALILCGIFLFIFPNPKQYIYGLVFGTSINVLNFKLMCITFNKSIYMSAKRITPYMISNYFIRYLIYGVMLTVSLVADYINFITAILGVFMVKIVILTWNFSDIILDKVRKQQ